MAGWGDVFWPHAERQIRVRGTVARVSESNRTSISHRVQGKSARGVVLTTKHGSDPREQLSRSFEPNRPALKDETSLDHLIGADTQSRQKSSSFGKVGRQNARWHCMSSQRGRTHGSRCGSNLIQSSTRTTNARVGAFWVEHVHGMVGRLVQSVQMRTVRPAWMARPQSCWQTGCRPPLVHENVNQAARFHALKGADCVALNGGMSC